MLLNLLNLIKLECIFTVIIGDFKCVKLLVRVKFLFNYVKNLL